MYTCAHTDAQSWRNSNKNQETNDATAQKSARVDATNTLNKLICDLKGDIENGCIQTFLKTVFLLPILRQLVLYQRSSASHK